MGIYLKEVRIRNFRSLREINVSLDFTTILVGANNSGKTAFLKALEVVFGLENKKVKKEDIYLSGAGNSYPNEAVIDVLIVPVDDHGEVCKEFDNGWYQHFGASRIQLDDEDNHILPIRTFVKFDPVRNGFGISQFVLDKWYANPEFWNDSITKEQVPSGLMDILPLVYLDAQRDIVDDLRNPDSFWGRIVADVGMGLEETVEAEKDLDRMNQMVIDHSPVLSHIHGQLQMLKDINAGTSNEVVVSPLPRKVRNLYRGIDVLFKDGISELMPLEQHGMGTRSWATLLALRCYISWLKKVHHDKNTPYHCMLALEEPEAHLHPQAQRNLLAQISGIGGQKIISTHSPFIASVSELSSLRHFRKVSAETVVSSIMTEALEPEDLRKIEREVMNTRGELLFARAIILCEGETEEQALPLWFHEYFGKRTFEMGVNVVGVGGKGKKYLPFLRVAEGLQIKWFIFSDGEMDTVDELRTAVTEVGYTLPDSNIVTLDTGMKFETYMLAEYYNEMENLIRDLHLTKAVNDHHKQAIQNKVYSYTDLQDELKGGKTRFGPIVAHKLIGLPDQAKRIPSKVRTLFEALSHEFDTH
ncbi:hypothetical protein ASL11_06305 [Paenibacillus sp. Soil750]|nr:hypothetical protein ASL11_06305 [Paenibacillus sp. Soil750]